MESKWVFFVAQVVSLWVSILLMVQKSQPTTWDGAKTRRKEWDKRINYQPQLVLAGFLNHQPYGSLSKHFNKHESVCLIYIYIWFYQAVIRRRSKETTWMMIRKMTKFMS